MKNLFQVIVFLIIALLFSACGSSMAVIPSVTPSPTATATATATFTPIPSPTATATVEPTSRPEFVPPTLIPTIDPTLVPELLSKAFSVQTMEGVNGRNMQQITGWDYGFGTTAWWANCPSYVWLDRNHILLYPAAGQESPPEGIWGGINVVPQPVVVNLDTGSIWLPPVNLSSQRTCNRMYWSPELEILITSEVHNEVSTVSTYTYDGSKLSSYAGSILGISPSRTKILIEDDTIIDLRTNKRIALAWSLENYQEQMFSGLFWTSDEKHIYRCCYFYADLASETSHRFERSDFQDRNGNHLDASGLWFYRGQWVLDNTLFLVEWSWIDDGDIRYLPLFDPAKKIFYDVREMAGISKDWHCHQTVVSPDGTYVWLTGWGEKEEGSYLVNLFTFESHYFPGKEYLHIDWSPNSKFAWLYNLNPTENTEQYSILSVTDKEIRPVPVAPESTQWWHPSDDMIVYPSADKSTLIFLDTSRMSYQELPFTLQEPPNYDNLVWSSQGKKVALVAEDGSLWQVDYATLENLEQLSPPLPPVSDLDWSPDGNSLSFVSGSDIYIVDTMK